MKTYKCRFTDKDSAEKDVLEWELEADSPKAAAEIFAEEHGLEDGSVVQVLRHGRYEISVEVEYTCQAMKV